MSDDLLRRALTKKQQGQKLSRDESRAIERAKREQLDRTLREALRACPKKLYVELSGRQHKILDDQAARYSLPLLGPAVDLFALLHKFHDLLAEHGGKLLAAEEEQEATDWANECKKEQALKARAERLALCGQLLRRHVVDATLQNVAALLRSAGERMQQQGHTDAYQLLDETLADAQVQIDELLRQQPPLSDQLEAMED